MMDPNICNTMDPTGDKRLPETSVQNIPHNLTTIQKIQHLQTVGNITATNVQTIQPVQNVVSTMASPCNAIVGKSIALDLNPKQTLMKSVVQTGAPSTGEPSKITTTLCPVGSTVRIISPGMLSSVERVGPPKGQNPPAQGTQQVVTTIPATYHVPRGPAAVANIAAPRSTVATPIVRATGQNVVPVSRPGVSTTISNPQWPAKTSVVYAQPQRQPAPPVSRVATRPPAVYSAQPARLVAPAQARPVQATVVTSVTPGTNSRLLTPVLQSNNVITRIPVPQVRPTGIPVVTTTVQPARNQPQTIQASQATRTPVTATGTMNRVTVAAPVVATASRISSGTSVTVQPSLSRQLTVNPGVIPTTGNFNRVVIPTQQVQQPQGHPPGTTRVVQTITSLANIGAVSRVIATTTNSPNARVTQAAPTSVARITGLTLHSLPLATTRPTPLPVKPVQGQTITHTVQIKSSGQQILRVTPANVPAAMTVATTTPVTGNTQVVPSTTTIIINNSNNVSNNSPTQASQPSLYSQYRQATPPVRLASGFLVEQGHEETHGKPNASPRPSILRKRDHDNSPAKSIAKNLVPVLASLSSGSLSTNSPPQSPRHERESGCQSSGSTTVSATSSPGLDEEPEQSGIVINQTMEMSPRKKPRKQQLTGVELTEARCTEEEMQFIAEDKIKREMKDDLKDKYSMDRKSSLNSQQDGSLRAHNQTVVVRTKPTAQLLEKSWKERWEVRRQHYQRPSEVRPREERRPTVAEIAQQKYVLQKINGWKIYQLTAQMEDLADLEKQVHEKLKTTLMMLESQQTNKNRQDDGLERANELIKGNMQRSSLISEGMNEARSQLITIFQHKGHVNDILQRCGNKRSQKKRDK